MSKTCSNCGKTLDDNVNYCPYCKSQEFNNSIVKKETGNSIIHKLFYWNYDGYYVLSKSKLTAISTYILMFIASFPVPAFMSVASVGLIFALLIFIIGFGLHQMKSQPLKSKIENNDYGLITDLKNLFFYWQNNNGEYALSKTKVISALIFVLFAALSTRTNNINLFSLVLVGLFFETPAFLIGWGIHRKINPNPSPRKEIKTEVKKEIPEVKIEKPLVHDEKLESLNTRFHKKNQLTRDLINKRFTPPQLTHTRFISIVDNCEEVFKKQYDSAYSLITLSDEMSPRIKTELESKYEIMESIILKLDDLANELIVSMDNSSNDDVSNLIEEMEDLIHSVKDY